MKKQTDYIIIGAGIVGAAVANELARQKPNVSIVLLEAGLQPAMHQSGRNSGVIHAGVYYPPGSLKARFCREGVERTVEFCQQHQIEYEQCGKLLIATNDEELDRMNALYQRCIENDLAPQMLSANDISNMEPNITGVGGFWVKQSGITNYAKVTHALLSSAQRQNALDVQYNSRVTAIEENAKEVRVTVNGKTDVRAQYLIACAGVYADSLARQQGLDCEARTIPFRGEYFRLSSQFDAVSQRLIYPIPNPAMPFLGVHLTKMIGGYTTVGPNAVLSPGREAYQNWNTNLEELAHVFGYAGTWKMLWQHRSSAVHELRSSLSKGYYAELVAKYCPAIRVEHFMPYRSGIRAQAVARDGSLLHDFSFVQSERSLHVVNAPSPAATSAMPIARAIIDKL